MILILTFINLFMITVVGVGILYEIDNVKRLVENRNRPISSEKLKQLASSLTTLAWGSISQGSNRREVESFLYKRLNVEFKQ